MAQDQQGKFAGPIYEFMALNPNPPVGEALKQLAESGSLQGWVDATRPSEVTADHPEWHGFEIALVRAVSMDDLLLIKSVYPEAFRREVMSAWSDDRYHWLEDKAARLRGAGRATVAV